MFWCSVALLALCASAQGRAVNISNTWVLPEEGFPVFYRYFRDRISWYEADAVCQFHHANLVTVDTTAQYDAVRAYLKELDISSAVWVGLIRSNPDGDFTWTDYRGLSGDGYWSSAPDARSAPLCAAADPAADYRWDARACGGPTVASFICELPVPQWALGNEGCMVRALPALTILYLPESAAVQLTADCGLAGVKRVQCTGNVKREDLLRDLKCAEEEEITSTFNPSSTSNSWPLTTDAAFTDQDTSTEITTEENATTEHEDDINQSMTASSYHDLSSAMEYKLPMKVLSSNTFNNFVNKNVDLSLSNNNNLHSNYIPKLANDNYLTNEQLEKMEDEKHMQHKMLHEEIARLGNLENIFTQPTDHFVPPLVMAKAKISDDMTVLSLQEKHAQQLAEQHFNEFSNQYGHNDHVANTDRLTTEELKITTTNKPLVVYMQPIKVKEYFKKDKVKSSVPKKYNEKLYDPKSRSLKTSEIKSTFEKTTELSTTHFQNLNRVSATTPIAVQQDKYDDDSSIDLTVILKDAPNVTKIHTFFTNYTGDVSKLEVIKGDLSSNDSEIKLLDVEATEKPKEVTVKSIDMTVQNITSTHEVVKITIISDDHTSSTPTVFEITTKIPVFEDKVSHLTTSNRQFTGELINNTEPLTTHVSVGTTQAYFETTPIINISSTAVTADLKDNATEINTISTEHTPTTINDVILTTTPSSIEKNTTNGQTTQHLRETTTANVPLSTSKEKDSGYSVESNEEYDASTNSSETIDDFQSPLLSGANEPLHRPNRSRRPQPPPNRNKFNPFRILG